MPNFHYYQVTGGEEKWKRAPASHIEQLRETERPMFITALAVSKMPEELSHEEKLKLTWGGPLYFDWDSQDEELVIEKVNEFLDRLEEMRLDLSGCRLYATGGRGYHLEIPQELFMPKVPKAGIAHLPSIYREMALKLAVDTLDLTIYSSGRGRMWREANVERDNGRFKVRISLEEMRGMTPDICRMITAEPRLPEGTPKVDMCLDLSIVFEEAKQKVDELMKKRAKFKPDPKAAEKAKSLTVEMICEGIGLKDGIGFQTLSTQLAIIARTAGWSENDLVEKAHGLIHRHVSDGNRYNTPEKRSEELRRMWRYMFDNPCYDFSIGAIKSMLSHSAPDLDGIPVTKEELEETIKAEEAQEESDGEEMDEYGDVAAGITLTKYGIYASTPEGKKRICAVSFGENAVLYSTDSSQIVGYETEILVNGRPAGRQTLELDVFSGLVQFNRFVARYGHSFQGTDPQVRTVMMRFVEQAKKRGESRYIARREGLDLVSIPHHEDPFYRTPFLVWADYHNVVVQKDVAESGLNLQFAGYPDVRGVFKTDLTLAPSLADWRAEPGNLEKLREVLRDAMTCQKSELLGKYIGWYVACFWKPLFQAAYGKFPLMHVNGAAGAGKCLGRNTKVLMADGTTKLVQNIVAGDQLLGPDGGVRNVLSTTSGVDQMYRITPVKGAPYVVNSQHILSLKKSDKSTVRLSDGTQVASYADVVNVNVQVYANSTACARKTLKGWRSDAVEFNRAAGAQPLDPYWLGLWLGDGRADQAEICKPEDTEMVAWWIDYAEKHGHQVSRYKYASSGCPSWRVRTLGGRHDEQGNQFMAHLSDLDLLNNKHIPDAYKYGTVESRLRLLAGLLDSDGHLTHSGYDWISKDRQLAEDFAFVCRSVGLACYVKECQKSIATTGFVGTYWRCSVSGDCDKIPCLDKKAAARQQIKRATVTGITVEAIGTGDYYGFEIDGDHLFLLGDFTVTHNSDMTRSFANFFYYQQEPMATSPGSTVFSLQQFVSSSASIPLVLDEYKPHTMPLDMLNKLRAMFRDAYNQTTQARGGGTRESDDYRVLQTTQLSAPVVFIAEATESEAAVMERVVLATVVPPPAAIKSTWYARFQNFRQNRWMLGILGQYLAAMVVQSYNVERLRSEFDELYQSMMERYMLNKDDVAALENGTAEEKDLLDKINTKERSVYNHTVAKFGFMQFRKLVQGLLGNSLDPTMAELEEGLYARMLDLSSTTTPEIIRVLQQMAEMSWTSEEGRPDAIRRNYEYAVSDDTLEIDARSSYMKYRIYMRQAALSPLFSNDTSFMAQLKDLEAYQQQGMGSLLQRPGVMTFSVQALIRAGVPPFKGK